jgi:prevent-host-death family protein
MGAYSIAQAKQQLESLVEQALTGEVVTITRDGQPVATLNPTAPADARLPIDAEYLEWMRKRALARPSLGPDSVTLVREMRDEER